LFRVEAARKTDLRQQTIDKEDRKKLASKQSTLVPLVRSDSFFQENPDHHPQKEKKRNVQPGYASEDTAFKQGFENVRF
jgi:hypothetical protein